MLIQKLCMLIRFYWQNLLNNKIVFVFGLIFPVLVLIFQRNPSGNLYGYWAYIMVIGLLNGMMMPIVASRESNYLKQLAYIVGSKGIVFIANLLVQIIVIELELFIFNIVAMTYLRDISLGLIIQCALLSLILIPLLACFMAWILILPMKLETVGTFSNAYIFIMIFTAFLNGIDQPVLLTVMTSINPFIFCARVYRAMLFVTPNVTTTISLISISITYIILSLWIVHHLSLTSQTGRY